MIISQIASLLKAVDYSPEQMGNEIGVSGLTLRRWLRKPDNTPISRLYVPAIRDACYRMIAQGRLDPESPEIQAIFLESTSSECQAAIRNLGLDHGYEVNRPVSQDQILATLTQIGNQPQKQVQVDGSSEQFAFFKEMGREWSERIATLWAVVQSKKLASPDKLVAYGALFYLLTPIDFIPDSIPFFGLLDDFGVLGIAAAYYASRSGGTS